MLLECKHLNKCFHKQGHTTKALANVEFFIEENEVVGLIGESGSGKSTLAKVLLGLEHCDSGQIILENHDISTLSGSEQKRVYQSIQMVFQNAVGSFNPRRTIGQSLREMLVQMCGIKTQFVEQHAKDLLTDVGLPVEYLDRYPHELSGGECQRVAIARAMAVKPKLLVCDEATSALDVSAQAKVLQLLLHLKEEHHMSILFITHDLPLVSSLADRLVIMQAGAVVESGDAKQIIAKPGTAYTKRLLEAVL